MTAPKQLVLVVDDDSMMRTLARATLEQGGFAVDEANDGQAGIAAFERLGPDIVLLDVMMPVLDGYDACAALRKLEEGAHVPVLMMTALDDFESINRAYEAGATDFITKPVAWPMLVHRVRYLLRAKQAFLDLSRSEAQLANAQRIARLGHWEWNVATGEVRCSEEIYRILGRDPQGLSTTADSLLEPVHADDRSIIREAVDAALKRHEPFNADVRIVRPDGTIRVVHQQGEVRLDSAGMPIRIQGTTQDITERKRAEEQIRQLALYDSLTGLPNRNLFRDQLSHALARAERAGECLAVLTLDLDRFQRINDTLGYKAGDLLLKETANRLTGALRQTDYLTRDDGEDKNYFLARQGGNEFNILLDGIHQAEDAAGVARRILDALAKPVVLDGNDIAATACVGIALFPLDGRDADALLRGAGAALHYAKQQATNGYQYYNAEMNTHARERMILETYLRRALDRREFSLHYQPIVNPESGEIVAAEALLRWASPELGQISPVQFIPLLEETGLILDVGAWVLRQAARDYQSWMEKGLPAPRIAVNVSALQLRQESFVEMVRSALAGHATRPEIEIEITESLIMENIEGNIEKLRALREMGIKLAIDDFGTGYSSLAYLARLPADTLKIDRSFIITMLKEADAMTLVSTMVSLAHSLRLKVVAEGVDSEQQASVLRRLACDMMQGYLVSQPVPAEQLSRMIEARVVEPAPGGVLPETLSLSERSLSPAHAA